jgi:hypothetical protein
VFGNQSDSKIRLRYGHNRLGIMLILLALPSPMYSGSARSSLQLCSLRPASVGSPSLFREAATKPIWFQVKPLRTGSPKERGLRRPGCLRGVGPADAPVPLWIRHIHRAEESIRASLGRRRASFMQHSDCTLRQEAVL